MWWQPHKFDEKRPYLEARTKVLKAIRGWFDQRGFHEVQTPILQVCPVMDTHIHGFKTEIHDRGLNRLGDLYLHTSPEFAMKKLLTAGMGQIYQLCPVFRNGEDGRLHSVEFTMLEWYRAGTGYQAMMEDSVSILRHVARELGIREYRHGDKLADPFLNWNFITVSEAFEKYAQIKLEDYLDDTPGFAKIISEKGVRVAPDDGWEDLFYRIMADRIEPNLGVGVPAILCDYPISMASLAQRKPNDPRFAERFEMYVCGVELCNGFGELTDASEQKKRFKEEMDLKEKIYGYRYPVDEDFIKALEYGMPDSSGNAIGFDRLVMLATGAEHIHQVVWAPVDTPGA